MWSYDIDIVLNYIKIHISESIVGIVSTFNLFVSRGSYLRLTSYLFTVHISLRHTGPI